MLKKIVLGLSALIVLVVVGIVIFGLVTPKYDGTISVETEASKAKAWAVFDDPALMDQWIMGYVSHENIKGDGSQPGDQLKMEFEQNGQPFYMTETITAKIPGEQMSFDLDDGMSVFHVDVLFEEKDGKTVITENMQGIEQGLFNRAFTRMMTGYINKEKQKMYNNLVQLIEESDWQPPQPEVPDTMMMDSTLTDSLSM